MTPLELYADDFPLPPTASTRQVVRFRDGVPMSIPDVVIEEAPVALVYNGISHAVMLASPADLEDFALGFSLSEGIVAHPGEIYDIEIKAHCSGVSVELEIATERFLALKERRRNLAGRTGCGLCGIDSLDALDAMKQARVLAAPPLRIAAIQEALRTLPGHQPLRGSTGAAHGAAWASMDGRILQVREDVGRHNALDKLIGCLAAKRIDAAQGFALITSRASYEMVQKAVNTGIHSLVAISAPTGMAVRLAEESGLLLAGFANGSRFVAYTHHRRLQYGSQSGMDLREAAVLATSDE
ncbi:formate dehydrogenase accessory sulfurtransferase FdhD [Noviherbaspirillum denitrificans]|uniref:formate dehydrogenase accessory sulfurtransferase FdhD n=1 Tax=Noviherbaspirillum denitrificans TaxID=1968433 RepID=UPI000B538B9D|nr:formate dehydrogenase accessory sulfurtransferase FdhD [Noviherbaspirillum denitrificans]